MITCLKNARLVQDGEVNPCNIVLEGENVRGIIPTCTKTTADIEYDLHGLYVSAGFIDMHVHGGDGHDFMDGTEQAFHAVSAFHLTHGTTAMLPTTLASTTQELLKTFDVFAACKSKFEDSARLLGMHIEGPYIAKSQCGAQDVRFIRSPDAEEYEALLRAGKNILRWTAAPELDGAGLFGDALCRYGILPSIGHSEATYSQVTQAISHGYRHITHLYSATSTIVRQKGFRQAGIVESAYLCDELSSEIIADGCHLPASLLCMAYRFIGPKRLALVTDAMRGAGSDSGFSTLGSLENGQRVIIEDGVAKMPDKTAFAGSICTADRLVRTMLRLAHASLPDAIRMITQTPAEILGISAQFGRISVGHIADIVVFDADINIDKVFTSGVLRYNKQGE